MAYYKITLVDGKVKSIQSSDTQDADFIYPRYVAERVKLKLSTQTDIDALMVEYQQEMSKVGVNN